MHRIADAIFIIGNGNNAKYSTTNGERIKKIYTKHITRYTGILVIIYY